MTIISAFENYSKKIKFVDLTTLFVFTYCLESLKKSFDFEFNF